MFLMALPAACIFWSSPMPRVDEGVEPTQTPSTLFTECTPPTITSGTTGDTAPPEPVRALVFTGPIPDNLLVVSLETTRRDRIGRFSGGPTTPFLDCLLDASVVLEDHRSCSNWTAPSMTCATSGLFPLTRGFWPLTSDPDIPDNPDDLVTLAKMMSDAGRATRLVSANAVMGHKTPGLSHGFDEVLPRDTVGAARVAEVTLDEIEEVEALGGTWYVHVHFMDPHTPYCPPEAYLDAGLDTLPPFDLDICADLEAGVDRFADETPAWRQTFLDYIDVYYDAEIRYWDDALADLWAGLEAQGVLDDTLVVFLTDHGEQFDERGELFHGNHLNAEENRSTAALWASTLQPTAWTGGTWHPDIAATVVDVFGLVAPHPLDGIPIGLAPSTRIRTPANHFAGSPLQLAAVSDTHAMTYDWSGNKQLFDIVADPTETTDVYDPADPALPTLWQGLDPVVHFVGKTWPHLGPPAAASP